MVYVQEKRFIRDVLGCDAPELGKTGGVPRQSCMIRIILDCGSWLGNMAAADAGDGLSRLPRQDTGGSVLRFANTVA